MLEIACLQIDIKFGDPFANMKVVESEFHKLFTKYHNIDVVVLPELWTTGYDLTRLDEIADVKGKETKEFIAKLAQRYQTNIVAGSVAKKDGDQITNTLYTFDRSGVCISEYSKVHLFKLMDEHHYLTSGHHTGEFELENHTCAGMICYDIRFPEWIRTHTANGAEVVFVVAEWPLARLEHWRTLLLSRAIENQCYIVACNRVGKDPNNEFAGHSMIIDPWGDIVAEGGTEPTSIQASLDLEKVKKVREQIPIFIDRRPDLYQG